MQQRTSFYFQTIDKWIPDRQASILIGAAGEKDIKVFQELGFKNVVISNLSQVLLKDYSFSFSWSQQNLENLSFDDETFDYVVVHAGLHHCQSPHRALLEMYRVARKALIAFEPPDNFLVRLMQKFSLAQIYEHVAVEGNAGLSGGVNNSEIPNFIYRWSEKEIEKTIYSYAPFAEHRFSYRYGSDEPTRLFIGHSWLKQFLIKLGKPIYRLWGWSFPKYQNLFAFMIKKPDLEQDLYPWLIRDGRDINFNKHWRED